VQTGDHVPLQSCTPTALVEIKRRDELVEKPKLLLVDSDEQTRKSFQSAADAIGCEGVFATNTTEILIALHQEKIGVVLLDAGTISEPFDIMQQIKQKSARIEVAILNERATIPAAVEAIKAGAADYFEKPVSVSTLEHFLIQSLERYSRFQPSVSTLDELEKQAIQNALAQADGDKIEAARLLSIGKTTLYRKLKEYGHHKSRSRHHKLHGRDIRSSAQNGC
jgi:DNA-binding NtrC family response regulator